MKRVLVTGAKGQLGETLQDCSVNQKKLQFVFTSSKDLNITDKDKVESFFQENNFDFCINCAAYTNVEQAETDFENAFLVNATGAKNLAKTCNQFNTILIHISTDYVFDGKKSTPYTEIDTTNPINAYGKTKLAGEQAIQKNMRSHYILRTSWLYSKKYGKNFYKFVKNALENNQNISVLNNQYGKPTSCEELADYIFKIITNPKAFPFGIYHASGNIEMTWFDFATNIAQEIAPNKSTLIAPTKHFPTKAKRPAFSVLDTRKFFKYVN